MSNESTPAAEGSLFSIHWEDPADDAEREYRSLSIPALLALACGLLTPLVFLSLWFLFLGILGILLSLVAILAVRRSEGMSTGGWMAQLGLSVSILSLVGVGVFWPYYQYTVRCEADRFFRTWFAALEKGDIPVAFSLQSPFWERRPDPKAAETWWNTLPDEKYRHRAVHEYVENKLIRTLIDLGDKADVSYYKTDAVRTIDGKDTVAIIYAVTCPVEGKDKGAGEETGTETGRETFFVRMQGKRQAKAKEKHVVGWNLEQIPNGALRDIPR